MLHTISRSPMSDGRWPTILQTVLSSDVVLLLQDGVVAGLRGSAAVAQLLARAAPVYALAPDVLARGLTLYLAAEIAVVDYPGFVALTAQHTPQCAW